jgi:hypothetical protein
MTWQKRGSKQALEKRKTSLTFVGVYISHKKHDQCSCFREVYVMGNHVDKIKIKKKYHFAYLTFISIPALSFLFVLGKRIT